MTGLSSSGQAAENPKGDQNRDQQRDQLLHCKHELLVLCKKMSIQETDLRRVHNQNEALKEELETVKKKLQSVKQGVINQRAKTVQLRE
ncbi:hypothetical protein ABVT39_003557 [Epinephelus coioides]